MTDIDMERLEYFRDRYHALVVIDYKVADDNHTGSLLSLDDVIKRLNKVTVENEQLKKTAKEFAQNQTQHNLWRLRTVLKDSDVE